MNCIAYTGSHPPDEMGRQTCSGAEMVIRECAKLHGKGSHQCSADGNVKDVKVFVLQFNHIRIQSKNYMLIHTKN